MHHFFDALIEDNNVVLSGRKNFYNEFFSVWTLPVTLNDLQHNTQKDRRTHVTLGYGRLLSTNI